MVPFVVLVNYMYNGTVHNKSPGIIYFIYTFIFIKFMKNKK